MRAGLRAAGVLGLALDQLGEPIAQLHRCDEQAAELPLIRVAGQVVEDVRDVGDDVRIGGEQPEVRVDLRRLRVVVARASVHVALHAVGFLPDHQTELGVRLELGKPVDHVDAVRLQPPRPEDVVALVESRLELDQHRHLFAGLGRGDEQRNQRRIGANTVERHLDRDDVRILHRGAKESLDRPEGLERMMNEDVLVADPVEDRFRILVGAPQASRREGRVLQLGPVNAGQLRPVAEAQSIVRSEHHIVGDLEVLDEDVQDTSGNVGFDVQQRDGAAAELLEAAVDALEQIVGLVFLDLEVGVADDPEEVRTLDLRAGEELVDVGADHVLEKHERVSARRGQRFRNGDEPRQRVGDLDARELGPAAVAYHDREILAQVRDEREWMARIERQRREHRADLAREVPGQVFANLRRPFLALE